EVLEQAIETVEVHSQNENVVNVEAPLVQIRSGKLHYPGKERRRILGVGQPILAQVAAPGVSEAVEEVLILIGVIKRRLRVGDAEDDRPEKECEHPFKPFHERISKPY